MGRFKREMFLHGTQRNPQAMLAQTVSPARVRESKLVIRFTDSQDEWIDESLVDELRKNKVKFNRKDMVFIARDKTGQIIWLERGNRLAGLSHLSKPDPKGRTHLEQLMKRFHVDENEIPGLIRDISTKGKLISNKLVYVAGHSGYERIYMYLGHKVLFAIGSNGFIVSVYPTNKGEL